jgi:hypothetical protein
MSIETETRKLLSKFDLENPKSLEELGYIFFGPLLFNFFYWLKDEVHDADIVLFNSREGYFLRQIYKVFKNKYNLPRSVYFKTSRRISSMVSFFNESDIYDSFKLHRYEGTLSDLLKYRFGIEIYGEDSYIDTFKKLPNLDSYINEILDKSIRLRKEYEIYIKRTFKNYKNVYMIDSGFQGSTQYYLEKTFNLDLKGRYITYKGNIDLKNTKGFYDFEKCNFKNNIIFFESVFTDKVGTYIDLVDGKFINEPSSENQIYFLEKQKIIVGAKKFIFEILENTNSFTFADGYTGDYMFNLMCTKDFIKNKFVFHTFFHDNSYVRSHIKKIKLEDKNE